MNVSINIKTMKVVDYNNKNVNPFQFIVNIPQVDNISKIVEKEICKQKTNFLGEKLYITNINNKEYEVTENDLKSKIELKNKKFFPSIHKEIIKEEVNFLKCPYEFNFDDILNSKIEQLKEKFNFNNCNFFEVNLQEIIDFSYENHKADTGFKLIRLNPSGQVKLKQFNFDNITKMMFYANNFEKLSIQYSFDNKKFLDLKDSGDISKNTKFNKIFFIIKNLSTETIDIDNLGIFY